MRAIGQSGHLFLSVCCVIKRRSSIKRLLISLRPLQQKKTPINNPVQHSSYLSISQTKTILSPTITLESNYSSSLSPPPSTSKHIKTMTLFKISTKKNNNKTHSASSSTTTSPILSPRSSVQEPRPDDFCTMTIEQALDQAFFLDQFVGSNHSSYQAPPVIKF